MQHVTKGSERRAEGSRDSAVQKPTPGSTAHSSRESAEHLEVSAVQEVRHLKGWQGTSTCKA